MSQWTHIHGIIRVDGLTRKGYAFGHNYKATEGGFQEFAKNWRPDNVDNTLLLKDNYLELTINNKNTVETILNKLTVPVGSEGPLEITFAPMLGHQKIWEHDGSVSGSFRINMETLESDIFNHSVFDSQTEEEDARLLTRGWYNYINDSFALAVYGDLRDMSEASFNKAFTKTLRELDTYFHVIHIDVLVHDDWEKHETRFLRRRYESTIRQQKIIEVPDETNI